MFGKTQDDGASFAFAIKGGQNKVCTCYSSSKTVVYTQVLCSIAGLDPGMTHLLTIQHLDAAGLWLNLDQLEYVYPLIPSPANMTHVVFFQDYSRLLNFFSFVNVRVVRHLGNGKGLTFILSDHQALLQLLVSPPPHLCTFDLSTNARQD